MRRITEDILDENDKSDILVDADSYDNDYGPIDARDLEGNSSSLF